MGVRRYYAEFAFERTEDTYEVSYDEIIENDGVYHAKMGVEEFSRQRLSSLCLWDLKRPTGKLNGRGRRLWEKMDSIYAKSYAEAKEIVKFFYPDQEIQMVRVRRGYVFRLD